MATMINKYDKNRGESLSLQSGRILKSDFFDQIPSEIVEDISHVVAFLKQQYGAKCYLVGGAVRDHLLGRICEDFDIECYGISPEEFETAMENLGAEGVGKSFFVYKYHNLDIALPRTEKKVGAGHRGFDVALATDEKEASKRRDFTINALMYDVENERILDFWHGLDDLDNKVLRVIDQKTFIEDSLRVLRAMQFAARLGFKVEKESCLLCQNISLSDLPKERVFPEFEKMFRAAYLHYGLYYLSALGIARQLFGIDIDRHSFFALSRELQRGQKNFREALRPYYFFYMAAPYLKRGIREILDALGAPKIYYKKIAEVPFLPEKIDCAFVARMALKNGIMEFIGNYHTKVIEIAQRLDIWEKPFDRGIAPVELMAEGFSGKALGDELERRTEIKIRSLNENCS